MNTTGKLLDQKRAILQQQQATNAAPSLIQQTQADITKLQKMLTTGQQKLQTAEQNPAMKKLMSQEILAKTEESHIISSGAVHGAYNSQNDPHGIKRETHADSYYNSMRNREKSFVVSKIAGNTGLEQELISKMYDHLFVNKYDLEKGYAHFDSDYYMAQSMQRLQEGKNILEHDLVLVQHEALEYDLMNRQGMGYEEAHSLANESYNYQEALYRWLETNGGE